MTDSPNKTPGWQWRTVADRQEIHAALLPGMSTPEESLILDEVRQRAVYEIRSHVLSFDLPGHVARDSRTVWFDVPATPWQHWKHAHRDAWWLRRFVTRWPVRTRRLSEVVHFKAVWEEYALYPWQQVLPTGPGLGPAKRHIALRVSADSFRHEG